jgi:hypothetical protein
MTGQKLFTATKTLYWPTEFADIVNMLKGTDGEGRQVFPAMYRFNTGAMIFAAVLGLIHKRERDVGTAKQEISTDTFESQELNNTRLAQYVMLIPVLATQDVDLLRPDREDELLNIFQRLAAGGFEYLRGALSTSSDPTGHTVLHHELQRALNGDGTEPTGIVDILG